MKKLVFSALLSLVFIDFSYGQSMVYRHGLGVGVNGGLTELGMNDNLSNSIVGLNFHHQRNFANFFSIRTEINANYFLISRYSYYWYDSPGNWVDGEQWRSYVNTSLVSMPTFYFRGKSFAFYIGEGFGVSDHTQNWGENKERSRQGVVIQEESKTKGHSFLVGFRPSLGFTFMLNGGAREIDVMFSYNVWDELGDFEALSFWESDVIWYSLTLSYRFNFQEG